MSHRQAVATTKSDDCDKVSDLFRFSNQNNVFYFYIFTYNTQYNKKEVDRTYILSTSV